MARVEFAEVTRHFAHASEPAVAGVDLEVADGEVVVVTGPPGSGKTTLLRLAAGLEVPDQGHVRIGDGPPAQAEVALVFQNYAVYPHLTVRDNISLPLRRNKARRKDVAAAVDEVVEILGLGDLTRKAASTLSVSERMRVVLARSLVRRPDVLLMDEPLANLEHGVRDELRSRLVEAQRAFGATTLYATASPEAASPWAGRTVVLESGRLVGDTDGDHGTEVPAAPPVSAAAGTAGRP